MSSAIHTLHARATHTESRRLPAIQVRPGDLVVVVCDAVSKLGNRASSGIFAVNAGQCSGGSEAIVQKVVHTAQGELTIVVKHSRAPHPSGIERISIPAEIKIVTKSKI